MRARAVLGLFGVLALGLAGPWACLPDPASDFADFQERIKTVEAPDAGSTTYEAAAPPTEAVEGLYYGACYSELALGQVTNVLSFYTQTKFTPDASGGKLELTIEALKFDVSTLAPEPTVTRGNITGGVIPAPSATVDAEGRFTLSLGTISVPGDANPISQSEVLIQGAQLQGRFASEQWCGRLTGKVEKPAAAARDLDIKKNFCQFRPITEGAETPKLERADFTEGACPI